MAIDSSRSMFNAWIMSSLILLDSRTGCPGSRTGKRRKISFRCFLIRVLSTCTPDSFRARRFIQACALRTIKWLAAIRGTPSISITPVRRNLKYSSSSRIAERHHEDYVQIFRRPKRQSCLVEYEIACGSSDQDVVILMSVEPIPEVL